MNVQEATAKALLIDSGELAAAQQAGDVLAANAAMMDAYNTDVRPLLAELRAEMGLAPDPVAAYLASGYGEEISSGRKEGSPGRAGGLDTDGRRHQTTASERLSTLRSRWWSLTAAAARSARVRSGRACPTTRRTGPRPRRAAAG